MIWRYFDPRSDEVLARVNGIDVYLPRRFVHHYIRSQYEPLTRRLFIQALEPGMIVVDVGAHLGFYTVLAAHKVGPLGHVYAVEPAPDNLAVLRKNIGINRLQNVTILACAAGSARVRRTLHLTRSSDSHSFYAHPLTDTVQTIEVEQIPPDEMVRGPVHLIKVDAEGAELEVLSGMDRIFGENRTLVLCVEWNPACMRSAGQDPSALPVILRELGFARLQVIDDRARQIRSVEDVSELVRGGHLPDFWYVNIWASRV